MRRILSLLLAIIFASMATNSFPAEPMTEFRGIQWGTHISELEGMKFASKETNRLGWYYMSEIKEPFGNVELIYIAYGFLDGRFAAVTVMPNKGYDNFKQLEYSCRAKFGPPNDLLSTKTTLLFGIEKDITVTLSFNEEDKITKLDIMTMDALKERTTDKLRKEGRDGNK